MGLSEASHGGFWQWNTPLPYLYCGIAIVVAIIASSVLFLLCSHKDDPVAAVLSDSARADREDGDDKEKEKKKQEMEIRVLDPQPKVVVVFGGDGRPLYVARPQSSSNNNKHFCDQV
nr:pre-mRNA-splicing factor CWC15-like [Ipomoea trifida]